MPPAASKATAARSASNGAVSTATRSSTVNSRSSASSNNDAKRLKKRETDRRCQREARQRTKSRIAYLEGLVEELRRKDTSGQVASLMHQLSETRKERDAFATTLRSIEESVKGCRIGTASSPNPIGESQQQQQPDGIETQSIPRDPQSWLKQPDEPSTATHFGHQGEEVDEDIVKDLDVDIDMFQDCGDTMGTKLSNSPVVEPHLALDLDGASIDRSVAVVAVPSSSPDGLMSPPTPATPVHCSRCDPLRPPLASAPNIWAYAHAVMGDGPTPITPSHLAWDDSVSADLPARALAEGWAAAERSVGGRLPPLWAKLRDIDETVFGDIGKVERLAILITMHLLLRYHADGSETARKSMPAWYLARPSQDIAHSYATEFFTWPGIRERLVFRPHQYCTNQFWRAHNRNLRILWPESFSSCYRQDTATGLYSVTPEFHRRTRDINSWAMAPDFFTKFPELLGDIVAYGTLGRTIHPEGTQLRQKAHGKFHFRRDIRITEEDGEDEDGLLRLEAGHSLQEAKVVDLREANVLPEHDLLWFQGALTGSSGT